MAIIANVAAVALLLPPKWRNDVPRNKPKLIVIGKVRDFDDEAFKRLIVAYAYYLHDQRPAMDEDTPEAGRQMTDDDRNEAGS